MNILIVTGSPLRLNSSANLCHRAYIVGLIENGHIVDILEMSEKNQKIDSSIILPEFRNVFSFDGSIYSQLAIKKKNFRTGNGSINANTNTNTCTPVTSFNLKKIVKRFIREKLYGSYGIDNIWYLNVKHHFNHNLKYDLVISLSYPASSHKAANLLVNRNINTKRWIQIWEDPWSLEPGANYRNSGFLKEEHRILPKADEIIYVSPITLEYQKQEFTESADKMRWLPLPAYFSSENTEIDYSVLRFGYFGDYSSNVRNLKPFYNVAYNNKLTTTICGSTDETFESTDCVSVFPRIPIDELKKHEDNTNVLVFLCNLRGGQIPGKIYQQSATNKLILFILDGTNEEMKIIRDYFSQFNRYIFCENNEDSILNAINNIPKYLEDERYTKPLDVFSPKNIAKCIINKTDLDICQ